MSIKEEFIYDSIVELGIATTEEINLVRCVLCGSWEYILNAIIFARTGYKDINQFIIDTFENEK